MACRGHGTGLSGPHHHTTGPSLTSMVGTPGLLGTRGTRTDGFAPATRSSVIAPSALRLPPRSKDETTIVRARPGGMRMVAAAKPFSTATGKRSGSAMSGAVDSSTRPAIIVSATTAVTRRTAMPSILTATVGGSRTSADANAAMEQATGAAARVKLKRYDTRQV